MTETLKKNFVLIKEVAERALARNSIILDGGFLCGYEVIIAENTPHPKVQCAGS